ncbi:P22 phage major capsid protein family protein [Streptomyces sp. NPDC098789]|uniref:P22 phage major capsid protein family protein n=1 Tax=Streptomyces sp. NPDC098789 TaxID=3366098 RepID=UPI0038017A33
MANAFETDQIVASAIELLFHQSVLGETVHRDAEKGFTGGKGDSVRVRIPKRRTAKNFNGTTEFVDVNEGAVQVKLSDEPTDATKLTTREATLDVTSFAKQVLLPQTEAVARYTEKNLATLMNKATDAVKTDAANQVIDPAAEPGKAGHVVKALTWAASEFTRREINPRFRFVAVGPDVQRLLLDTPHLQKVNEAGDSEGLRNAILGNLFGFDVVVSPHINGMVAYHRDAMALAVRVPEPSMGTRSYASVHPGDRYGLRITHSYDPNTKAEISTVDSLCGSSVLDAERMIAFKLK